MQGKQFLYFIQNANDQFATFQNGFLEWVGYPLPLEFTPDGWQDISILTEKNKKYFGLERTYGAPQSFVEDGANILKSIFYNHGIEETIYLVILEQQLFFDDTYFGYYYTKLCKCEIDLSTISHEGEKVSASLLEGDITKYIKANESTKYDISLDADANAVSVLMDGLNLYAKANYVNPALSISSTGSATGAIPIVFTSKEGDQANILNQNSGTGTDKTPFIESVKGVNTFKLEGSIKWAVAHVLISFDIILVKVKAGVILSSTTLAHYVSPFIDGSGNGSGELILNLTETLNEGEGLFFLYNGFTSAHVNCTVSFSESPITASYTTRLAATQVKALKPYYLFQQLVSKLTDGKYSADSTLLQNLDPFILFTSGDGIRQIPGSYIKTSLADFFGFMNMRYCVGMGLVNGKLVMEKKQYWANDSNVIPLSFASGLKVSIATDYLFSNFSIGYPNKLDNAALGDINGRYEFCITHQYTSPDLRSTNSLDLNCNYHAGMYVTENTRLNSQGKTTTDGSTDNDVFVLNTMPVPNPAQVITIPVITGGSVSITLPSYYILDRTINAYATGLLDSATAFNLKLSPKQCLIGVGAYLRSCLTNQDHKKLKFTTADKNVDLRVAVPGKLAVNERDDISIDSLDPAFFKNYMLEFTCEPPTADEMSNPLRKFSFTYNSGRISLAGFDIKTGTQPADNRQQVFSLLASADCDLTQLTEVFE
jgi:hypothetical protein